MTRLRSPLAPAAGEAGGGAAGSVVAVVASVLAAHLLFVGLRLLALDDLRSFADGYDGLAYYRLALDPLTLAVQDHGVAFTRPAYWQSRIGYPVTCWALSLGGRADLVPVALVVVNLLAITGITVLAVRLAVRRGRSAWWGAVPAMWAGFLVGLGQDLTEPLAGLLLLGGLVLVRSRRHVLATLALIAAALTRETTLVVALAMLAARLLLWHDGSLRRTAPPWWVGVVPLAVYAGWRTWVRDRWSETVPHPPSDNPLGLPGLELVAYLGSAFANPVAQVPNLVLLVPTLLALALAATAVRSDGPLHERLALVGYLLVLASLPVWDRGQAYLRWGDEAMVLGWLLLTGRTGAARSARALAPVVVLVWLVTATQSVAHPAGADSWGGGWWTWS